MRGHRLYLAAVLLLLLTAYPAGAQYWFQSGARAASVSASQNSGASVQIQTIQPQNISSGSMAFWVGENLANGAFLQIGYTVFNRTGSVPNNCTPTGCTGRQPVTAGNAEWFYEYFPAGDNSSFFGSIGPDGSAGVNGTFMNYSFYSQGNVWYFEVNGTVVGSADLGTGASGPYTPTALAEIANTSTASTYMLPVVFANLSAYKYGTFLPVQDAYGIVGYGTGSETRLANLYGVEELDNRVNYFAVGSGLPRSTNGTQMWNLGYRLTVVSQYGNIASKASYIAYSTPTLSAPGLAAIGPGARAVFVGWTGSGRGAYTGTSQSQQLFMSSNITEIANWQVEYFLNASSQYGTTSGSGWYKNGATAAYGITNTSFVKSGKLFRFSGWSNGNANYTGVQRMADSANITADWQYRQVLVGTDAYGKSIAISSAIINGSVVNSTPFLRVGVVSRLTGVYYKGLLLAVSQNITQNSTPTVSVGLPVYNVYVRATDVFGLPVNATAIMQFEGGGSEVAYGGASGAVNATDVPYGYANVTLSYFGQTQHMIAKGGELVGASFISPIDILSIAAVLSAAIAVIFLVLRRGRDSGGTGQGRDSKL